MVLGSSLIFFSNGSSPVVPDDAVEILGIIFGSITFKIESGKGSCCPHKICHKSCLHVKL